MDAGQLFVCAYHRSRNAGDLQWPVPVLLNTTGCAGLVVPIRRVV